MPETALSPAAPIFTVTSFASLKTMPLSRAAVTVAVADRFSAIAAWAPGVWGSRSTDSAMPPVRSSFRIVFLASRVPAPPARSAFAGLDSRRTMVSSGSRARSPYTVTGMGFRVCPGANVSLPGGSAA